MAMVFLQRVDAEMRPYLLRTFIVFFLHGLIIKCVVKRLDWCEAGFSEFEHDKIPLRKLNRDRPEI